MVPLDIERAMREIPEREFGSDAFGQLQKAEAALQRAKDNALPTERQGPTIYVGEVIDIKGGRFEVTAMSGRKVTLKSLPAK